MEHEHLDFLDDIWMEIKFPFGSNGPWDMAVF